MKNYFILLIIIFFSANSIAQNTGCVSGDCEDGYGKYVWTEGDIYVGEWKYGKRNGEGSYFYSGGEKYIGSYKDDKRHGFGTYTWTSGNRYVGQWMEGKKHGEATFYYADGSKDVGIWLDGEYVGEKVKTMQCVFGDCENGEGTYMWPTGEKYTGDWTNFKRNGQGTNYFADGRVYSGEWKADLRQGYGKQTNVDGTILDGMWEDDRFVGSSQNNYGCISGNCTDGYGVFTWSEGDRYEGNFKNSFRNGYGTYKWADGGVHKGYWKDGKQHGNGTYTSAAGKVTVGVWKEGTFETSDIATKGCIEGDCTNGFGTFVFDKGSKYKGSFVNSKLQGQGTYYHTNGDEYVGEFKDGTYHGQGTYTFADKRTYVGEFAYGTYNGTGTMIYADGTTKSGTWKNGKLVSTAPSKKLAVVTWILPSSQSSTVSSENATLKLCVQSDSEIENVQFFVNGKMVVNNQARGFTVVSESCDYTLEHDISLQPGTNTIKAIIRNEAGKTETTSRTITYAQSTIKEKRLALVIGNSAYSESPLRNPANDANAIATTLRTLGFEVYSFTNIGQADMKREIRNFGNKLSDQRGIGLFYFAGHGIQLNGENYLVPTDADIQKEQDVELEAVNLKRIMGEMDYAQNDLNIIILDACRNNPFARSFRSSGNQGLASTTAPSGTFIAYATAPGSVASDGVGENGLYTQELLQAITKPNTKIEDVFKQVRNQVYTKSGKQQVPWENSSIFGDFYFKK